MAKRMKLAGKEVKRAIKNMLHMFKKVGKKYENDEERNGRCKKLPNGTCRDLKHIKPEMKNITSWTKSRLDISEIKISELKDTSTVASESKKKLKLLK